MKQLMLGNEAVARGLYEAGCSFVSSYPGTPSTEITECAAKFPEIYAEWAPNEKVAVEAAFGASLAGKRSFCGMKHVGLNVAADPLFTISYTGVNAGMIIGVANRGEDIVVNACRKKQLTNTRASGSDDALRLVPPRQMSLEQCLEFLADDELLEVTPKSLRMRKAILNHEQRMKSLKGKK